MAQGGRERECASARPSQIVAGGKEPLCKAATHARSPARAKAKKGRHRHEVLVFVRKVSVPLLDHTARPLPQTGCCDVGAPDCRAQGYLFDLNQSIRQDGALPLSEINMGIWGSDGGNWGMRVCVPPYHSNVLTVLTHPRTNQLYSQNWQKARVPVRGSRKEQERTRDMGED